MKMATKNGRSSGTKYNVNRLGQLVMQLSAVIEEASGDDSQKKPESNISSQQVKAVASFNVVVKKCLNELPDGFAVLLHYKPDDVSLPSKSKKWVQLKGTIRDYLLNMSKLLKNLASADALDAVLKHTVKLVVYIACFPKLSRVYSKILVRHWSTGEETSRILAFLAILRLMKLNKDEFVEKTLKLMYMEFVRNSKFTSSSILPMISFMQHSLVEFFSLRPLLGYQYAFVYIRQLAINLRNAIASKKKDCVKAVYNWQYMHSCMFFVRFVCSRYNDENIKQLLYPLVWIITGVIKLIPSPRFYPLRFQCIRMLNYISSKTKVYIPTLTHILQVLEITDFKRKKSAGRTRPIDFTCTLKLSKSQTQDVSFQDTVMDQLYELIIDHLVSYSQDYGFPELMAPAIYQMKQFIKSCRVPNYTKLFKQLLDKTNETIKVVEQRRAAVAINLSAEGKVVEWEKENRAKGTPLLAYYKHYRTLRNREVELEISGKERLEDYDHTPLIPTGQRTATNVERQEFSRLFEDDDDDDLDEESIFDKPRRKRKLSAGDDDADDDDDDDDDDNDDDSNEDNDTDIGSDDQMAGQNEKMDVSSEEDEEDDAVEDFKFSDYED